MDSELLQVRARIQALAASKAQLDTQEGAQQILEESQELEQLSLRLRALATDRVRTTKAYRIRGR